MAEETFYVVYWKIENFSYWCEAVHGKSIESPRFFSEHFENVKLFPRGGSGQDDHMEASFCGVEEDFRCDLSFIAFDGSVICSQQVRITDSCRSVPGPKFEEVSGYKDGIILRFCIPSFSATKQRMCTTISVSKIFLKIHPELIGNFQSNTPEEIFYILYKSENGKGLSIKIARKEERIQMTLEPYDGFKEPVVVQIDMSILSSENTLIKREAFKHIFIERKAWTFSKLQEWEENETTIILSLKIINGKIIEGQNYEIYRKEVSVEPNTLCVFELKPSASILNLSGDSVDVLTKDLMCLYQDQDFSDFTLKCDGVSIPVHRNILSARSPVFKSMLSTGMREAASGQVDIGDLDPSTLARFLAFLYSGGVEDMQSDIALKLYYAADKYQVPTLKEHCANYLCANVSISNVCGILSLADKHKDDDLLSVSYNHILDHYSDVLGSKEWARFKESEPMLAVNILTDLGQKKCVVKRA